MLGAKKLVSSNFVHKWVMYRLVNVEEDTAASCDLAEVSTLHYNFLATFQSSGKIEVSNFDLTICPNQDLN